MFTPWKKSYDQPRQHIKKQRHYLAYKGPSSQGYGFSSGHVWMWELDYKESWALKNWCFWTVVLEKTLESTLDCKEIQPVHPKGNQSVGFPRQEHWSGLLFLSPGDLPNPGIEPVSPAWWVDSFTTKPPGKPLIRFYRCKKKEAKKTLFQKL